MGGRGNWIGVGVTELEFSHLHLVASAACISSLACCVFLLLTLSPFSHWPSFALTHRLLSACSFSDITRDAHCSVRARSISFQSQLPVSLAPGHTQTSTCHSHHSVTSSHRHHSSPPKPSLPAQVPNPRPHSPPSHLQLPPSIFPLLLPGPLSDPPIHSSIHPSSNPSSPLHPPEPNPTSSTHILHYTLPRFNHSCLS